VEYQTTQVQLTTDQNARFIALKDSSISKSVKIVSIADIRANQPNDTINFILPGISDTLSAEASLITDDSTSGFQWSGKLLNIPGYLSILYHNGLTAGFIQVQGGFYEFMPVDTNYQFLVKRNNNAIKNCGMPAESLPPPDSTGPFKCIYPTGNNPYNTCPALVSVLLVITAEAKTWILDNYGSIEAYAKTGEALVNLAFYNSDIPNKEIRVEWIERLDITLSDDPPNIDLDRSIVDDILASDRQQHKADIAVLLTNQDYGVAGAVTGFGPSSASAFAIVEVPYFISQFTFAHELGHLFGCRHNWPVDTGNDNEEVCAHAKRWIPTPLPLVYDQFYDVSGSWSTLVGIPTLIDIYYPIDDGTGIYYVKFLTDERILHYSNPNVYYNSEPTGRDDGYIADNARFIRNEACTVANFFPTRELALLILYDYSTPCLVSKTFSAHIVPSESGIPGQPPFNTKWYWNTTGIFGENDQSDYLGQGDEITLSSYPACPVFWLKCIVTSSDGITVSRVRKVVIGTESCCSEQEERSTVTNLPAGGNDKIFPNPITDGTINIEFDTWKNLYVNYMISDVYGRVLSANSRFITVDGNLNLNVEHFDAGAYLLHVKTASGQLKNFIFIILQK
jgi:hypothetical protein